MPAFCRHNRFVHRCPICSPDKTQKGGAARKPRGDAARSPVRASPATARRTGGAPRAGRLVTKRLERAADDGYRNELVPGIKATADAARLAACLAAAAERLAFPGPHPAVAEAPDAELATWWAFLLALAGPDRPELQAALIEARPALDSDADALGPAAAETVTAYRQWVQRAGSQAAALTGDVAWSPERRFARAFERLTFKGFGRSQRFEFLAILGAAGIYDLEADALHVDADDRTVTAAKRALLAGEWMLLERRAARLARETGVPLAALDRGLALWDGSEPVDAPEHERIRDALGLA